MCDRGGEEEGLRNFEYLFPLGSILTSGVEYTCQLRVREEVSLAVLSEARGLPPRSRCSVHASVCVLKISYCIFYSSYVLYLN